MPLPTARCWCGEAKFPELNPELELELLVPSGNPEPLPLPIPDDIGSPLPLPTGAAEEGLEGIDLARDIIGVA